MTNNPVAEAITEYWGDRCSEYEPNCPCCEAWAKYDALTSTSAEPVAYQVAMSDGRWGTIFHHPDKPIGDHRPLYAHPPTPVTVGEATKEGPVRTVTRKEIVPGVYGRIEVDKVTGQYVHIAIGGDSMLDADELTDAIETLTQIRDALRALSGEKS